MGGTHTARDAGRAAWQLRDAFAAKPPPPRRTVAAPASYPGGRIGRRPARRTVVDQSLVALAATSFALSLLLAAGGLLADRLGRRPARGRGAPPRR